MKGIIDYNHGEFKNRKLSMHNLLRYWKAYKDKTHTHTSQIHLRIWNSLMTPCLLSLVCPRISLTKYSPILLTLLQTLCVKLCPALIVVTKENSYIFKNSIIKMYEHNASLIIIKYLLEFVMVLLNALAH